MKLFGWNRLRTVAVVDVDSTKSSPSKARTFTSVRNPSTLDELCVALRRDEILDFRFGFGKPGGDDVNVTDLKKSRHLTRLVRAIRKNTSLQSAQLGCRLRSRFAITQILNSLQKCTLLKFQLILWPDVEWLPEEPLKAFLLRQRSLEVIDIQGLLSVVASSPRNNDKQDTRLNSSPPRLSSARRHLIKQNIVSCIIVHLHRHERLKSLFLVDCNVNDTIANELADFLHVRGGIRVSQLCLRQNRSLTWAGLRVLCQAPVLDILDLSLCDLGTLDARVIAASIAKRPWTLRELVLCGNHQIDACGWIALTSQECCEKIAVLNLSYCTLSCQGAVEILDSLKESLSSSSKLQEIHLQGCRRIPDEDNTSLSQSLCRLLSRSTSLRVVRFTDNARHPIQSSGGWSFHNLNPVLSALQSNYEMEVLLYDSWRCSMEGYSDLNESLSTARLLNDMDFVLRLNQAGRRFLRDIPPSFSTNELYYSRQRRCNKIREIQDNEWLKILENAGKDDLDVLYWIVHECADRFGSRVDIPIQMDNK